MTTFVPDSLDPFSLLAGARASLQQLYAMPLIRSVSTKRAAVSRYFGIAGKKRRVLGLRVLNKSVSR